MRRNLYTCNAALGDAALERLTVGGDRKGRTLDGRRIKNNNINNNVLVW